MDSNIYLMVWIQIKQFPSSR